MSDPVQSSRKSRETRSGVTSMAMRRRRPGILRR
jgi:hypothetical protein